MLYDLADTFEELGRGCAVHLEADLELDLTEGEPMVRYYPDGSGYPGSPPTCELSSVTVTEVWGDTYHYHRADRPEWFELLDRVMANRLESHWDDYGDRYLERASEELAYR